MKSHEEKLSEKMWAVANEYARRFGEIIEHDVEFWVSDEPEVCCFGDYLFFTFDEMRAVVDHIEKYVARYGSLQAVGEEVVSWVDWWLDGSVRGAEATGRERRKGATNMMDTEMEYVRSRVTKQLRPNICLESWLDGCPREDREPWTGPDADYLRLCNDRDTLARLIGEYSHDMSLFATLLSVKAKLEIERKAKEARDKAEFDKMMNDWQKYHGRDGV